MNRTGIEESRAADIQTLVETIAKSGLVFRGLHYYDGHHGALSEPERLTAAHFGYDRLMAIISISKAPVTTCRKSSPRARRRFPHRSRIRDFATRASFVHRISPGTVVYGDATMLSQLPSCVRLQTGRARRRARRQPSPPQRSSRAMADTKRFPLTRECRRASCSVIPELTGIGPSEEHLPLTVREGAEPPPVGEVLYLLPRHICPTVNLFDDALIIRSGAIESVERVTARGRENPVVLHGENRELTQTAAR